MHLDVYFQCHRTTPLSSHCASAVTTQPQCCCMCPRRSLFYWILVRLRCTQRNAVSGKAEFRELNKQKSTILLHLHYRYVREQDSRFLLSFEFAYQNSDAPLIYFEFMLSRLACSSQATTGKSYIFRVYRCSNRSLADPVVGGIVGSSTSS